MLLLHTAVIFLIMTGFFSAWATAKTNKAKAPKVKQENLYRETIGEPPQVSGEAASLYLSQNK
ncbi:hypothetical protein AI29_12315 [bacteria symbiont BFo2 of Frankliniella occidentalis]|nr:hypothetical protein AI29_12315 [bacteria symbiont BFo2 of Frankliniella occidentalis]KYP96406.1 hypothetical protein WB67_01485 [bacteria symbiont BFo2 of Frankliniella occidentalis]